MQMSMINEQAKGESAAKQKKKSVKHVPEVAASAKFIVAEKKESDKEREKAAKK